MTTNQPQHRSASTIESWAIPQPIWAWLRWPLWVGFWAVCILQAADRIHHSQHEFETGEKFQSFPQHHRADSNSGHTLIDFGGQWLAGRTVYEGYGKELYDRNRLRDVARRGFPIKDEHQASRESIIPTTRSGETSEHKHDADAMMSWLMGSDPTEWQSVGKTAAVPLMRGSHGNPFASALLEYTVATQSPVTQAEINKIGQPAIGGALYPPVHGLMYAPLAALPAQKAYFTFQWLSLLAAFVAGLAVWFMSGGTIRFSTPADRRNWYRQSPKQLRRRSLSRSAFWNRLPSFDGGRVWWPAAMLVILLYPGTRPGLDLGQNHLMSMTILVVGWALFVRGYETAGGIVWGFLAYKPVWAVAFIFVPMLMGRVRFFIGMAGTGMAWILITLPFVGVRSWFNWLEVGNLASGIYSTDKNWLLLSRDLAGLARRLLVDVEKPPFPQNSVADVLGWLLPGAVVLITATVYLLRADRSRTTGVAPAFLLVASYLSGFRFMYYDVTLSLVAFAAMFAIPHAILPTGRFTLADGSPASPGRRTAVGYFASVPILALYSMLALDVVLIDELSWVVEFKKYARTMVDATGGTSVATPGIRGSTDYHHPVDTYILLGFWAWCAWRVWRDGEIAS